MTGRLLTVWQTILAVLVGVVAFHVGVLLS